ncbi:MAG: hypothetical protein RLZ10_556 [Bacteroidota bacterium]
MKIPEEFVQEYKKIEAYCAHQEHCEIDVRIKLKNKGLSEELINLFVHKLILNNFIDNVRYCNAYVHDHIYLKKWGKLKIKSQLRSKFIDDKIIQSALESIPDKIYLENLKTLLDRKKIEVSNNRDDYKTKAKILRYLASKGYESEMILNLVF